MGLNSRLRRKFEDAYKQSKDKTAKKVLYYMRKLYATEDKIRSQEYLKKGLIEKIVEIRQKESKPILEYLHGVLSELRGGLPESIGVGSAKGAEASAFYYSLIQTFKVSNLNVMDACLKFFSELPRCKSPDEAKSLFCKILGWG